MPSFDKPYQYTKFSRKLRGMTETAELYEVITDLFRLITYVWHVKFVYTRANYDSGLDTASNGAA